jgi:hypothetical protein
MLSLQKSNFNIFCKVISIEQNNMLTRAGLTGSWDQDLQSDLHMVVLILN